MNPFEALKNFNINDIKSKTKEISEKMKNLEVVGEAGGGFVKVKINGNFAIVDIQYEENEYITKDLCTFKDLIISAQNVACEKMKEQIQKELTASIGFVPPGLFNV